MKQTNSETSSDKSSKFNVSAFELMTEKQHIKIDSEAHKPNNNK